MPLKPVKLVDAGGGGDCFFYSLYRAAKERGKLDELMDCFSMGAELDGRRPKADFMERAREYLARNISVENQQIIDIHTHLLGLFIEEEGDQFLEAIFESLPEFYREEFASGPGTIEEFAETIGDEIEKPGTWVGQIEVDILKELLDLCGIRLVIMNTKVKELEDDESVLYLYNQDNVHYKFFSFSTGGRGETRKKQGGASGRFRMTRKRGLQSRSRR